MRTLGPFCQSDSAHESLSKIENPTTVNGIVRIHLASQGMCITELAGA